MDNPRRDWTFFHQQKGMDEVRQSILLTMELEDTRMVLTTRNEQIAQLKQVLRRTIRERDEALLMEKLLLQQQSGIPTIDQDSDESIVSSPHPPLQDLPNRALPEKGKLLQAVMEAGPLLHILLLAGPLPQWQHPPPPIDTYQIPPPTVSDHYISQECGRVDRKRAIMCEGGSESFTEFKYQRVLH